MALSLLVTSEIERAEEEKVQTYPFQRLKRSAQFDPVTPDEVQSSGRHGLLAVQAELQKV